MKRVSKVGWIGGVLVVMSLLSAPASAQFTTMIIAGSDLLNTAANGNTFVDFFMNPIPPDFFCPGSPEFSGTIKLRGEPLLSEPPGILGTTDTIVERLHDVDLSSGAASVAIMIRALKLVGMSPLVVPCNNGDRYFTVKACLSNPTQPVTQMDIWLEHDLGGSFNAQLMVEADLIFTDMAAGRPLPPIPQLIDMMMFDHQWMFQPGPGGVRVPYPFLAETGCWAIATAPMPPTTNFFPGWNPSMPDCFSKTEEDEGCHENPGGDHVHCVGTPCSEQ